MARKLAAGRVLINTIKSRCVCSLRWVQTIEDSVGKAGIFGLQEYLEPKAIIG